MKEFEKEVVTALEGLGWGAQAIQIGAFSVWHLTSETPAYRFDTLIRIFPVSKQLAVLRARSSFDPEFAAYLLSRASEDWLESCATDRITIALHFDYPGKRYAGVGMAPPAVARSFGSQSPFLADHAFWVFPVLREDFRGDEDHDAFHFRLGKGGQIPIINWNRDLTLSL